MRKLREMQIEQTTSTAVMSYLLLNWRTKIQGPLIRSGRLLIEMGYFKPVFTYSWDLVGYKHFGLTGRRWDVLGLVGWSWLMTILCALV